MSRSTDNQISGWAGFAGFLMIISGFFGIFEGLNEVMKSSFYTLNSNALLNITIKSWGWTHLVLSAFILLAGFAVLSGKLWGKTIGLLFALFSSLAYLAFIPYYAVWSIIIVVFDVLIIHALIVHGEDLK